MRTPLMKETYFLCHDVV